LGQKLANTCSFVGGHIIMQKKISRAKHIWMNPVNALHCIYCFSIWYEFFVHYALRVEKNYQHGLDVGPLEYQFLWPRGCLTNPFGSLSLCFGVTGKTSGLISRNYFVKKIFVCIGHHVLARCDLIFLLLRCQGV